MPYSECISRGRLTTSYNYQRLHSPWDLVMYTGPKGTQLKEDILPRTLPWRRSCITVQGKVECRNRRRRRQEQWRAKEVGRRVWM